MLMCSMRQGKYGTASHRLPSSCLFMSGALVGRVDVSLAELSVPEHGGAQPSDARRPTTLQEASSVPDATKTAEGQEAASEPQVATRGEEHPSGSGVKVTHSPHASQLGQREETPCVVSGDSMSASELAAAAVADAPSDTPSPQVW